MKKILLIITVILLSGCSFKENFDEVSLCATIYPVEYAAKSLYGDYAKISSIYPNSADKTYTVTKKKKDKFSKSDIFIYSGLVNEANIAKDLLNLNNSIKLIDATKGMNIKNDTEELWLDPSNFLMLSSNIKRTLLEYAESPYKKIEEKYDELNENISELDVLLYSLGKNGNYNTILTTNNVFKYLTKYNINVISIDEDNETLDKEYASAKNMIKSKKIQFIYSLEDEELTEAQEKFIGDNKLVRISINNLYTLSDEERNNNEDYLTLMKKIIEEYKRELYK